MSGPIADPSVAAGARGRRRPPARGGTTTHRQPPGAARRAHRRGASAHDPRDPRRPSRPRAELGVPQPRGARGGRRRAPRRSATDEFARWELTEDLAGHHHHLICATCGRVEDVPASAGLERSVAAAAAAITRTTGFRTAAPPTRPRRRVRELQLSVQPDGCSCSRRRWAASSPAFSALMLARDLVFGRAHRCRARRRCRRRSTSTK